MSLCVRVCVCVWSTDLNTPKIAITALEWNGSAACIIIYIQIQTHTLALSSDDDALYLHSRVCYIYVRVLTLTLYKYRICVWFCRNVNTVLQHRTHCECVFVCGAQFILLFSLFVFLFFVDLLAGWLVGCFKCLKTYLIFPRFIFHYICIRISLCALISLAVGFLSIVVTITIHLVCCLFAC